MLGEIKDFKFGGHVHAVWIVSQIEHAPLENIVPFAASDIYRRAQGAESNGFPDSSHDGPFQQIIMSEHDNDLDNTEVKSCDFAHI